QSAQRSKSFARFATLREMIFLQSWVGPTCETASLPLYVTLTLKPKTKGNQKPAFKFSVAQNFFKSLALIGGSFFNPSPFEAAALRANRLPKNSCLFRCSYLIARLILEVDEG
ncbi:MAG: hypothetical protein IT259_06060, partial [Saprospiraceae bacterium]|nr:hypothetical protein [Saprospiraceae bacterium]